MTITLPEKLAIRLSQYAEHRNTDPVKLVIRYVETSIGCIAADCVCCECGEKFRARKGKSSLFCGRGCYKKAPFPRLGIGRQDIQRYYGSTIAVAAEALGVSGVQMRRTIKKLGLMDRFEAQMYTPRTGGACSQSQGGGA